MPLYAGARYGAGFQSIVRYEAQTEQLCPPTWITDPVAPVCTGIAGPASVPGWDLNENMRAVEGAGSGRDLAQVPGRRECTVSLRLDVADATFLTGAFRSHAVPLPGTPGTGWINGLRLMALQFGIGSQYSEAWSEVGVDALWNSLRFEVAENQNMTADGELWPMAFVTGAPATSAPPASPVPIIWQTVQLLNDSTDLKPILAGITFSLNNNLERVGSRALMPIAGIPAREQAISRIPFAIRPRLEKLTVQYRLHDVPPNSLLTTFNMGLFRIYGEEPGIGARRNCVTVDITNNHMGRVRGQQVTANNILTYETEHAAYAVTCLPGVTA